MWTAWSGTNQPLDKTHVGATFTLTKEQTLVMFVDGVPYTGDPNKIVLKNHEVITLEISPPTLDPPPPFTFASGL